MNTLWMRGASWNPSWARLTGGVVNDDRYLDVTMLYGWRAPIRISAPGVLPEVWTGWIDPITGQRVDFHYGLDLWAPQYGGLGGMPYRALGYGVVSAAYYADGPGYLVEVTYQGADAAYRVQYFHMSGPAIFAPGTPVEPGMILGYMGTTGMSTGPHLHVAVYANDSIIDPLALFAEAQPLGYVPPAPAVPAVWHPSLEVRYLSTGPNYWQHHYEVVSNRKQHGQWQGTGMPYIDASGNEVWPFDLEDWE